MRVQSIAIVFVMALAACASVPQTSADAGINAVVSRFI
jgi:hypothetical protein